MLKKNNNICLLKIILYKHDITQCPYLIIWCEEHDA